MPCILTWRFHKRELAGDVKGQCGAGNSPNATVRRCDRKARCRDLSIGADPQSWKPTAFALYQKAPGVDALRHRTSEILVDETSQQFAGDRFVLGRNVDWKFAAPARPFDVEQAGIGERPNSERLHFAAEAQELGGELGAKYDEVIVPIALPDAPTLLHRDFIDFGGHFELGGHRPAYHRPQVLPEPASSCTVGDNPDRKPALQRQCEKILIASIASPDCAAPVAEAELRQLVLSGEGQGGKDIGRRILPAKECRLRLASEPVRTIGCEDRRAVWPVQSIRLGKRTQQSLSRVVFIVRHPVAIERTPVRFEEATRTQECSEPVSRCAWNAG